MNKRDMLDMAFQMTIGEDKRTQERDLYYNPRKDLFLYQASTANTCSASTRENGKSRQEWVNGICIFIGRYEVNVNPFWIFEDMKHV